MKLNKRALAFIDAFSAGLAEHYGVTNPARAFSLTDPQETSLRAALLESVEFLDLITIADVDQLSGQVVQVGKSGLHTGRVAGGRFRRKVGVDGNDYKLVETDSCAELQWDLLSLWANAGDEGEFFQMVQTFSNQAFALDMLRIGFNGKEVATTPAWTALRGQHEPAHQRSVIRCKHRRGITSRRKNLTRYHGQHGGGVHARRT